MSSKQKNQQNGDYYKPQRFHSSFTPREQKQNYQKYQKIKSIVKSNNQNIQDIQPGQKRSKQYSLEPQNYVTSLSQNKIQKGSNFERQYMSLQNQNQKQFGDIKESLHEDSQMNNFEEFIKDKYVQQQNEQMSNQMDRKQNQNHLKINMRANRIVKNNNFTKQNHIQENNIENSNFNNESNDNTNHIAGQNSNQNQKKRRSKTQLSSIKNQIVEQYKEGHNIYYQNKEIYNNKSQNKSQNRSNNAFKINKKHTKSAHSTNNPQQQQQQILQQQEQDQQSTNKQLNYKYPYFKPIITFPDINIMNVFANQKGKEQQIPQQQQQQNIQIQQQTARLNLNLDENGEDQLYIKDQVSLPVVMTPLASGQKSIQSSRQYDQQVPKGKLEDASHLVVNKQPFILKIYKQNIDSSNRAYPIAQTERNMMNNDYIQNQQDQDQIEQQIQQQPLQGKIAQDKLKAFNIPYQTNKKWTQNGLQNSSKQQQQQSHQQSILNTPDSARSHKKSQTRARVLSVQNTDQNRWEKIKNTDKQNAKCNQILSNNEFKHFIHQNREKHRSTSVNNNKYHQNQNGNKISEEDEYIPSINIQDYIK